LDSRKEKKREGKEGMERRDMKRPLTIAHTHSPHTRIKLFFLSTDIAFFVVVVFLVSKNDGFFG
jgi:hypothetical protein